MRQFISRWVYSALLLSTPTLILAGNSFSFSHCIYAYTAKFKESCNAHYQTYCAHGTKNVWTIVYHNEQQCYDNDYDPYDDVYDHATELLFQRHLGTHAISTVCHRVQKNFPMPGPIPVYPLVRCYYVERWC